MKDVGKVFFCGLLLVVVSAVAAMFGMPGARDGELHLAGDYYFTHSGGFQNSITEKHDGQRTFVISMKVEEFVVEGNGIFVTRRPVLREDRGNNRWDYRLSENCEYYRIGLAERKVYGPFTLAAVSSRAEWAFLKERRKDQDFGATMCKLNAIKN